ncbi:Magnesium-chelatase 38 kDa subunit [Actinomadura rubteroloni]|uniref:Mg-protoporphyrin IX chelatase n=1 Tax=Actinomadura rubteroloni TaxID=1926885 RepID=A0A2P4URM6_9ACTN|nr:putative cobaltochelatase [Actinomadura rubteroloni]POM27707.1 Magnesium-chelatase 38 kDa subunit [Actinomadura rubteroloni]
MASSDARYPFSAIVGMDDLKLALLVNAVSPRVGGVLVRGEKGTAKSTIVRALAALLPPVPVVPGCRFSCDPSAPDPRCPDGPHSGAGERPARLVELPVGAAEDRLTGSLDIERALTEGVTAFEPGLLAAAHRGVLYVDEVNLLHDHLVDLLLDAAAMGESHVEREGVSVRHAARFLLVGTMNPEEGELRPQLLDRFGLTVEVAATRDPAERAEVVRRRLRFEDDPGSFAALWASAEAELAGRIAAARALLPDVALTDAALRQITAVCAAFDVDGLRADLVTARAALALAAWNGRTEVTADDVRTAARLALPHRRRRDPFDAPGLDRDRLDEILDEHADPDPPDDDPGGPGGSGGSGGADDAAGPGDGAGSGDAAGADDATGSGADESAGAGAGTGANSGAGAGSAEGADASAGADANASAGEGAGAGAGGGAPDAADEPPSGGRESVVSAGAAFKPRLFTVPGLGAGAPGRRSKARTSHGRVTGARPGSAGIHLTATLRAAAPRQRARGRAGAGLVLRPGDLRAAVRDGREGNLVLFVVDASGSMAARRRMTAVKGAVLSLLRDAYQRRDKVGLVTFRGRDAEVALPPTSSVEAGARRLERLPTGGRTPLAAGLVRAAGVLRAERLRDPARRPLLVLVTDGRATSGADPAAAAPLLDGVACVVVDCESGPVRLGLAAALGARLGAETVRLDDLAAGSLAGLVRAHRAA